MPTLTASRSHLLLEKCPQEYIPINFCNEDFIHEAIDPGQAHRDLETLGKRAHVVLGQVQQGVNGELAHFQGLLVAQCQAYPAVLDAVEQDKHALDQRIHAIAQRARAKLSRVKPVAEDLAHPEFVTEMVQELRGVFEAGSTNPLRSFAALKGIQVSPGRLNTIRDTIIGMLCYLVIGLINTVSLAILTFNFGALAGFALAACIIAPIVEEAYKALSVRITKGSQRPAFVTFLLEFLEYAAKIFLIALSSGNIFFAVGLIIIGITMRFYALEMHMTTTQFYATDVKTVGYVRLKTFGAGVVLHAIWNLLSIIFEFVQGITKVFLLLQLYVEEQVMVSITGLMAKYFHRKLSISPQERPVSPPPRLDLVPAHA